MNYTCNRRRDCALRTNSGAVAVTASMDRWLVTDSTTASTAATNSSAALSPCATSATALSCALRRKVAPSVATALRATLRPAVANRKHASPTEGLLIYSLPAIINCAGSALTNLATSPNRFSTPETSASKQPISTTTALRSVLVGNN